MAKSHSNDRMNGTYSLSIIGIFRSPSVTLRVAEERRTTAGCRQVGD